MFVTTRPTWPTEVIATTPDGVITRHTEHMLCYTNIFDEEMRIPVDPESEQAKAEYAWRKDMIDNRSSEFNGRGYSNLRWESRVVTTITTPWKTEENS